MLRPLIYIGAGEHLNINIIMEFEVVNIFDRPMTLLTGVMLKANERNGDNIMPMTLGQFLDPTWQYQYYEQISAIRRLCPTLAEKERNRQLVKDMKLKLPAGIMSGVVENGISEQNLVELNNVLQVDIDAQDNPAIYDWQALKDMLSKSPFFAYIGMSVTGLGLFGLIPIEDSSKFKEHFDAVEDEFANTTFKFTQGNETEPTVLQGIKIDPIPRNPASKRFVSYDPNPYWNTAAEVYTKRKEPIKPITHYDRNFTSNYTNGSFDVEDFFKRHNISYTKRARHSGTQYIVDCPWIAEHSSKSRAESAVFVYPEGGVGYKCLHAHCADRHWRQYREFYEPGCYDSF